MNSAYILNSLVITAANHICYEGFYQFQATFQS